jgi:hypothetical protein
MLFTHTHVSSLKAHKMDKFIQNEQKMAVQLV